MSDDSSDRWWETFREETLREAKEEGLGEEASAYFETGPEERIGIVDTESARRDYEGWRSTLIGLRDGKSPKELSKEFFQPIHDALGEGEDSNGNPFSLLVALPADLELPSATAFGEAVRASGFAKSAKLNTTPGAAPTMASVSIENHRIGLNGNHMPVGKFQPGLLQQTLQVAHTDQDVKTAFKKNQSYYICRYAGDSEDPLERWIALNVVASAFLSVGCLGVLNPIARTFLPPETLGAFQDPELVKDLKTNLPVGVLTNVVQAFTEDGGTWCLTYGNELFNLTNLAVFIKPGQNPAAGIVLLHEMSNYMYNSGKKIKLGERIESGDTRWMAKKLPDEVKGQGGVADHLMLESGVHALRGESEDESEEEYEIWKKKVTNTLDKKHSEEIKAFSLEIGLPGKLKLPTKAALNAAVKASDFHHSAEMEVRSIETPNGVHPITARITIGKHRVDLSGLPIPSREENARVASFIFSNSQAKEKVKERFMDNQSSYTCSYVSGSDDPLECWIAVGVVASAFTSIKCLGAINRSALVFIPPTTLKLLQNHEFIKSLKTELPVGLFTNVAQIHRKDGSIWNITYGNENFGLANLAALMVPNSDPSTGIDLLHDVTNLMYTSGQTIKLGDHVDLPKTPMIVTEVPDALKGYANNESHLSLQPRQSDPDQPTAQASSDRGGCLGNMIFMLVGAATLLLQWLLG